ncbi:proline iminopeptidase [Arthrobacter sp. Hiyo8]|nr:proline iminopeptidase [Arthrobacter sp. Hiyo8]
MAERVVEGVAHTIRARHEFRGVRTTEHFFAVPLDHWASAGVEADSTAETITVFAREFVSAEHSEEDTARLPWLLYLQGGPADAEPGPPPCPAG